MEQNNRRHEKAVRKAKNKILDALVVLIIFIPIWYFSPEIAETIIGKLTHTKAEKEALHKAVFKNREAQDVEEIEAKKDQATKSEMARFEQEIAQHKAEDNKKAEFERQFKPRAECNNPMLEWSKTVQCINERLAAKDKFYSSH